MAVFSIVGTSGVGKSFLVKQLASFLQVPAFFEGEEGTIPAEILNSIFDGSDPVKRWKFFLERYKNNLERAHAISETLQLDCFVDGGLISARAIVTFEPEQYREVLLELLEEYMIVDADVTVLLTATEETIINNIKSRSRESEISKPAIDRALSIQDAYISLTKEEVKVIVIDRSVMDFAKYKDVEEVLHQINKAHLII